MRNFKRSRFPCRNRNKNVLLSVIWWRIYYGTLQEQRTADRVWWKVMGCSSWQSNSILGRQIGILFQGWDGDWCWMKLDTLHMKYDRQSANYISWYRVWLYNIKNCWCCQNSLNRELSNKPNMITQQPIKILIGCCVYKICYFRIQRDIYKRA